MKSKKDSLFPLGMIIVIVLIVFLLQSSHEASINEYVSQHHWTLVSRDSRIINTGPFWRGKNDSVYRVVAKDDEGNNHVVWIKFGICGMQVEKGSLNDGD